MKTEIKELFNVMPNLDDVSKKQWFDILNMPDEQFDEIYPKMREQLSGIYKGEEFQSSMLTQIKTLPHGTLEEESAVIKEFLDLINDDYTLSKNKKEMINIMFKSTLEVYEQLVTNSRTFIEVRIVKLTDDAILPKYAHNTDAGADVCAAEEVTIEPNETKIVKTGLAMAIPVGYEIQMRPRSGLSAKTGLRIANSPGTIDAGYRGEVGVIVTNTGSTSYTINKGTPIAQFIIAPVPMIRWVEVNSVDELGSTDRGEGGFGSTDSVKSE